MEATTDVARLGQHEEGDLTLPFRFMDLPPELRNHIYELVLVVPDDEPEWMRDNPITDENRQRLMSGPKIALHIENGCKDFVLQQPPLLKVTRQIRQEADSYYWGQGEWQVNLDAKVGYEACAEDDLQTPMRQMQKWVDLYGLDRLKHLRDFTLGIEICNKLARCGPELFRVTFEGKRGLQFQLKFQYHHLPVREDVMDRHLAVTEKRRKEKGQEGEGIIDFFMGNKDFWAEWFFSYPDKDYYPDSDDEYSDGEYSDDEYGDDEYGDYKFDDYDYPVRLPRKR